MDITFRTRKLAKTFNEASALQKAYGSRMARTIMVRMAVLKAAHNLAQVPALPPERRHQLRGDRSWQYAVDLVHPYRLVLEPLSDGGNRVDAAVEQITAIMIVDVVDYH